ncbi:MAG TPA: MMPL family transporter [Burkholderiaceae bacterium]|nr:MMPL family transporter [Burkholderiaceae bacterium]
MTRSIVSRRGWIAVVVWLAALAAGAGVIAHARFSTDLSAFLPAAPDARQRALIEQLRSGVAARTLLIGIRGGDAAQRAAASRALAQRLRADPAFEQVLNGDFAAIAEVGRWVLEHRYLLSPAVDARRFSADGLREAIDDTLSLLGTPAGALVKPLLDRDPTGEVQRIAESALSGGGPRTQDGIWVSRDGQQALLMTHSRADGGDLDAQARALALVRDSFAAVAAPGLDLRMSGAPKFAVDSRAQIQAETRALAITGTVLMGGLMLLAFASLRALAAAMVPVATGIVAGVAAVSLVFGNVHGATLGFGTTLIGEAVDYAIYYLIQARGAVGSATDTREGAGWRRWVRESWPTVRLGVLTSVCGFLALAFSGFPGLAQLGVFSIAGLIAAALTTRCVLPVWMPDGASGIGARRQLGRGAAALVRTLPRARHLFTALGVAALVLLVVHRDTLWQTELSSLSPVSMQALALDTQLRDELLAGDERTMVAVSGSDLEAVLQAVEAVGARLDALVQSGQLHGYDAITRWLPSRATQQRRRAALPDAATLQASLAEATRGGSLSAGRLAPFVHDVQSARAMPPITRESLAGTPVATLAAALLVRGADGTFTALLPVVRSPGRAGDGAPEAIAQALQGIDAAQSFNVADELRRLYGHYIREAQGQALFGAAGVVLLMALWLRSPSRLLAVCKPLALAVLLTMAGFAALGVPLGILHLVGLLLVVAVGSNYSLFLDWLRHQHKSDDDTLASLLLANLTIVLSFGLIAASAIPALSAIGRVVAPGALLALLLSAAYAAPTARTAAHPS